MNTLPGVWLDDLTRQEALIRFGGDAVAVIPVVSAGTPAPHLPLKTAPLIARALGQKLLERLPAVVAPVVDADSFSRRDTLGQVLVDRLDMLKAIGARRIAILEMSPSPGVVPTLPAETLVLHVGDWLAADEYPTSCLMALDPRSVRMPLLPAGSRAQAFAGERAMAFEVDALADALRAKWPDLA
ncbi:hypothetical protein [Reyranella sp.]|uniref:hypothetical protein n=1 Tax=Reyranella sp. TaxID=1929291 RepID=UPI003D0E7D6C